MNVTITGRMLLAVLLIGCVALAGDKEWPHFRGPGYDGIPVAKPFTATAVKKVWEATVHKGMSSVSIVGDRLYTMGNKENNDIIVCLNAADGKEIWRHSYPCKLAPNLYEGGPSATPTVHEGKVYTVSKFGHIFCTDAGSGKVVWNFEASRFNPKKRWWGYAGSPTIVGDVACFNVGGHGLGLNKTTGKEVWSSEAGVISYASMIPLPRSMLKRSAIAVLTNKTLHVLDPATGKAVAGFEKPWGKDATCSAVSPVVHDGTLYVTHANEGMSRLTLTGETFKPAWKQPAAAMSWFTFNKRVFHGKYFYFLKQKKEGLCCVNTETGKVEWTDDSYRFGNLILVGDTLFVLNEKGELAWGPLKDGRFKKEHTAQIVDGKVWGHPVIHNGRLYVRTAKGALVCMQFE